MAFDFGKILSKIDLADIPVILGLVAKYSGLVKELFKKEGNEVEPNKPPPALPEPVPGQPTGPSPLPTGQVYFEPLKCAVFFNERNNQVVPLPQMGKDRVHLNISPSDARGNEIRTGDPRHVKVPGDVPVRYRWWRDGKLNTAGEYHGAPQQEEDHFHLESVVDADNGFTPVLKLEKTTPGGHRVEFEAFIPAEFNGGKEVVSNRVEWVCD